MNKKEIDDWLKDVEARDKKTAEEEDWGGEDYPDDLHYDYHYVVVIPEDIYEQLSEDQQAKFDGCDLLDHLEDYDIQNDFNVDPDDLNPLWERKFYHLTLEDQGQWEALGNNKTGNPVDEVLIFNL